MEHPISTPVTSRKGRYAVCRSPGLAAILHLDAPVVMSEQLGVALPAGLGQHVLDALLVADAVGDVVSYGDPLPFRDGQAVGSSSQTSDANRQPAGVFTNWLLL